MDHAGSRSLLGGKYLLGSQIGVGGMGTVHLGFQPGLRRTVAVKILRPELVDDPRMHRHFRREALVGTRLAHPGLAAIHELATTDDGRPALVMEYVPGRLLGSEVREHPFDLEDAHSIIAQLLAILAAVHRAGVVHGDLKADNLILQGNRGGAMRIRLIDFGLARVLPGPGDDPADPALADDHLVDRDGQRFVSGTPEYMAPEVIYGGLVTAASDLYAAGILLYELLTGATPFGGGSTIEVITRQVTDAVLPPSVARPDRAIPPALEAVLVRALAKEPRARFRSAAAFGDALARAVPAPPARMTA